MNEEEELILAGQTCPYCKRPSVLTGANVIYGKEYYDKYIYLCRPCDAYVGCHPGTCTPLGSLSNKELRQWRQVAHSYFDPMWKNRPGKRGAAYAWMTKVMDLRPGTAHIGMFTVEQCKKLVELCKPFYKK